MVSFTMTSSYMPLCCFDHISSPVAHTFFLTSAGPPLTHNCSPVLLFLSFGLHTRPNMTLSESTWQPLALFILLMTWATCHLRSSVDFSLYSIMSVFRKFWSLKPIQSRFSDQDIVFSSAHSFLELPQVYTSNCVAKTTKMYFLTALESWIHLRPPHLACRWPSSTSSCDLL